VPPDPSGYRCDDTVTRPYIDATNDTGITQDDQIVTIPIGFIFNVYGGNYATVGVSSNGNLQFTTQNAEHQNTCLSYGLMGKMIAPFWDDLNPLLGGGVYYSTTGSAPNRILTVEWRNLRHFPVSLSSVTFEVQLEEATGDIYFLYQDVDFGEPLWNQGSSATVGMQRGFPVGATQYSCNQPVLYDGLAIRLFRITTPTPTSTVTLSPTPTATPTLPAKRLDTPTPTSTATSQPSPLPSMPTATACPGLTDLRLVAHLDEATHEVIVEWHATGGCRPVSVELTAQYAAEREPYLTLRLDDAPLSGQIVDRPPRRCGGPFRLVYQITLTDALGQRARASAETAILWACRRP
jgi:hypothetical protein